MIEFNSIDAGKLYLMTLRIANASNKPQRIRIKPPTSEYFAINYLPTKSIAPGLDIRVEIECQLPSSSDKRSNNSSSDIEYTDHLIVHMGDSKLDIPILASRAHSILVHDNLINFGCLSYDNDNMTPGTTLNPQYMRPITVKNVGTISGRVSFKLKSTSLLVIEPKEVDLKANESAVVNVSFNMKNIPKFAGIYRDIIDVSMTKARKPSSLIDVMATFVERKLVMLSSNKDMNGIISNLELGYVCFGQTIKKQAIIVNSGSTPLTYRLYEDPSPPPKNEEIVDLPAQTVEQTQSQDKTASHENSVTNGKHDTHRHPRAKSGNKRRGSREVPNTTTAKPTATIRQLPALSGKTSLEIDAQKASYLTFTPSYCSIPPFSERVVDISFQPILQKPSRGFLHEYITLLHEKPCPIQYNMVLETLESSNIQHFVISSTLHHPNVSLSHTELYFGQCATYDRRDIKISMTNHSLSSMTYKFANIPFFKSAPSEGLIHQHQTVSIIVSYLPLQLGKFDSSILLSINNCPTADLNIRVHGEANISGTMRKKCMLTGGIDKLPEDFQETYHFIDPNIELLKSLKLNYMPNEIVVYDAPLLTPKTHSEGLNQSLSSSHTKVLPVDSIPHPSTNLFTRNIPPPINISSSKTLKIINKANLLSTEISVILNPKKQKSKLDMATESLKLVEADEREFAFDERRREQEKVQRLWEEKKNVDKIYNAYLKRSYDNRVTAKDAREKEKFNRTKVMDDIVLDY